MKHILVHRESRLQQFQTTSTGKSAFCWMSLASSQRFRVLWLIGRLAFALLVGRAMAQCPPVAPTSTATTVTNCLSPNGTITFTAPNTNTHVFSINGGVTFGAIGETVFTNLAPGNYSTVAKLVSLSCVSPATTKTITVTGAPVTPTSTVAPTNCNAPTGTITFTAPAPATHVFSTDGGVTFGLVGQTVFTNLAAGTYSTVAKLVSTGCVSPATSKTVVVTTSPVTPTSTLVNSTNCLTPNGSITFSAPTPVANYQFSVDGGTTFGTTGQTLFSGLAPGTYQTRARLVSTGCVSVATAKTILASGAPVAPTSTVGNTNCNAPTGTITFTAPAPATHVFSIDGGATFGLVGQTVFNTLAANSYSTVAKLVSTGCVSPIAIKTVAVTASPVAPTSTVVNPTNCLTPNGSITFTAPTPLVNYQFSIDGGSTFGTVGQTAFPGLAPGAYQTVSRLVSTGCVSLTTAAATKTLVTSGAPATPTSTVAPTYCNAPTGTITFTAPAPATHVFSIDGGGTFAAVGQTVFTGLGADNYQTVAKNVATGCLSTVTTKTVAFTASPAGPTSTVTNATNCISPNGSIAFSAPALASHVFSIDGGETYGLVGQTVFTTLLPGTYQTVAKNILTGCESAIVIKTLAPATAVPAPTSTFVNVSSCSPNNGSITFSAPTPLANYQFSIDGGATFGTAGQTLFSGLAAGGYTTVAKLISTGCVSSTTAASVKALVNTVAVPVPSFVANNGENNCATPGSIIFSAPSPVTHVFSVDGGATFGTPGQVVFPNLTAGTYSMVAKLVSTGCQSLTAINTTVTLTCNNVEVCDNGVDDDGDGFTDQYDPDCPCTLDGFINVCQPDCEYQPTAKPFTIKKAFSTPSVASNQVAIYQTPVVGDVDGDGVVEIVGVGVRDYDLTSASGNRSVKDILIFNGKTGLLERTISTGNLWINWGSQSQLAIGNTDTSDDQAEIYTITHTNISLGFFDNNPTAALTCYRADGTLKWRNTTALVSAGLGPYASGGAIGLADFNGDGIAEVYVYNKIYNAVTGALLVNGASLGTAAGIGSQSYCPRSVAADLTAHPGMELAAGKSIYEITITNPNGTVGNTIVEKRMPTAYFDGNTAIADMDLDGQMDVVVRYQYLMYVYNPRTMSVIAQATVTNAVSGSNNLFIGDVDNDGRPDIGITAPNYIGMYTYNGTTTLALKWSKTTTDGSGQTGITMFDFNQDGKIELLYRDETNMRIMDGTTGNNIVTFPSASGTGWEGPIVADVNSDGQANIIVTSGVTDYGRGVIDVFSTASFPWAPSRKVWNQVGYNVTNIKDDLTIPTNPQDNASVFTNGKRVFNNFMQQSTIYDKDGNPVFPAVDVRIVFNPDATDPVTGYAKASKNYFVGVCENSLPVSASLTIPLVNNGNVPTPANMPVSIYLGDPFNSASAVLVDTIIVADPIDPNGGTFTTSVLINTTGFTAPFKLYAVPGDPGATSGFPLNVNTYFLNLDIGFCSSARNFAEYGEFSCTCPVITNNLADNFSPTACGVQDGIIKVCGLTPNSTGNILNYDKDGVAQPALTNLTADESGCLSLTGLSAGTYSNINVSNAGCTAGSNLIGPLSLTAPAAPSAPTASITSQTICTGGQVAINYTTNPAGQIVSWVRTPGGVTNLGNVIDFPTALGTTPESYTYSAKITGAVGCESTTTTTVVTVNPQPVITPSLCSQTICSGETGSITFVSNIVGTSINWLRVEDGATGTGNISSLFATAGNFTYKIWGTSPAPASCPTSTTITCVIVVDDCTVPCNLTVTASASQTAVCIGGSLTLSASVTPAGSYTYSWSGPDNFTSNQQNPVISNIQFNGESGALYTVTVTDALGCTASQTVPVNINFPNVVITSNSPQCTGNTLSFSATAGMTSYAWTGPNGFNSNLQNPTLPNATTAATGSYTLVVTDALGCTASFVTSATIAQQPSLTVTAGVSQTICSGQSTTLTVGGNNGSSVTWNNSLGQNGTGTSINFAGIRNLTTQPISVTYVVEASAGSCSDQEFFVLTINPEPVLQVVPSAAVYCNIEDVKITATVTPATATISWTRSPGGGSGGPTAGSLTVQETLTASPTPYQYTFTATGANGCSAPVMTVPVTVQQ